jgi:hypothetical protein
MMDSALSSEVYMSVVFLPNWSAKRKLQRAPMVNV